MPVFLHCSYSPPFCRSFWLVVSEGGVGVRGCALRTTHGAPGAMGRTHISLDRVSGRLLDKDHNMTLFLLCPGSVNRSRASTAPVPSSWLLITRLTSLSGGKNPPALFSSAVILRTADFFFFFTNDNPYAISGQRRLLVPPEDSCTTTPFHSLFSFLFLGGTILPN